MMYTFKPVHVDYRKDAEVVQKVRGGVKQEEEHTRGGEEGGKVVSENSGVRFQAHGARRVPLEERCGGAGPSLAKSSCMVHAAVIEGTWALI